MWNLLCTHPQLEDIMLQNGIYPMQIHSVSHILIHFIFYSYFYIFLTLLCIMYFFLWFLLLVFSLYAVAETLQFPHCGIKQSLVHSSFSKCISIYAQLRQFDLVQNVTYKHTHTWTLHRSDNNLGECWPLSAAGQPLTGNNNNAAQTHFQRAALNASSYQSSRSLLFMSWIDFLLHFVVLICYVT